MLPHFLPLFSKYNPNLMNIKKKKKSLTGLSHHASPCDNSNVTKCLTGERYNICLAVGAPINTYQHELQFPKARIALIV